MPSLYIKRWPAVFILIAQPPPSPPDPFPDDEVLRKKWMSMVPQVLNLSEENISSKSYLCVNHFDKDSFVYDDKGKVAHLKDSAVPAIFYIPQTSENQLTIEEIKEDDPDVIMGNEEPPVIPKGSTHAQLLKKVQSEVTNLFVWKEKVRKEEEEALKVEEQLKYVESGDRSLEVEETYQRLLKKMRPIAPKVAPKKKPKTLEEVIVSLRKDQKVSEEAAVVLLNLFADVQVEENPMSLHSKEGFQCFGQVLAFYSAEVLENLKSMFDINVPKISTVRSLYNNQTGEPGWSNESFLQLKNKAKKIGAGGKLLCSLLVSEMGLRREEEWDGKKVRGFVDCGPLISTVHMDMDVDGLPRARSVLALMVTPLDRRQCWRLPVAYFFISNLTSSERANVFRECILRLHSVGTVVLSVTLNAHSWDKRLFDSLGVCSGLFPSLCPYFVHPADPLLRVHVIFDVCSVLTSVKNLWYGLLTFKDIVGSTIDWKYVSELIKVQEAQAGSVTQTFDGPIWCWDSDDVKDRLLSQLFTCSTADAMEYCWTELKLIQFEGCEATVHFIRKMSKISHLLNAKRYTSGNGSVEDDASLSAAHIDVLDYLSKLEGPNGNILYVSNDGAIRHLYLTVMSALELLRQIPGFSSNCVSLDHNELLFYCIRSYIGWDIVPTARQFATAFRTHVLKHGYFTSWTSARTNSHWWVDAVDVAVARKEGRLARKPEIHTVSVPVNGIMPIVFEHIYPNIEFGTLSAYQFVAMCVVKTLARVLHCNACLLGLQAPFTADNPLLLLLRKTCGAVLCPSRDVLLVCAAAERQLQLKSRTCKRSVKLKIFEWRDDDFVASVGMSVVEDLLQRKVSVFASLDKHFKECPPDASHLYRLIRGISCCYIRLRIRKMKSWCPL